MQIPHVNTLKMAATQMIDTRSWMTENSVDNFIAACKPSHCRKLHLTL